MLLGSLFSPEEREPGNEASPVGPMQSTVDASAALRGTREIARSGQWCSGKLKVAMVVVSYNFENLPTEIGNAYDCTLALLTVIFLAAVKDWNVIHKS